MNNNFYNFFENRPFLFFCILILLTKSGLKGQIKNETNSTFNHADVVKLYKQCLLVREDTVNRICMGFLSDHDLRKNTRPFSGFCNAFKNYCKVENNMIFHRRMTIIELHGRMRFDSATTQQANQAFEELYETYLGEKDYPASLECLFELGQFLHRKKDNIQAIKVLFYAEKFATNYNLQQKISYQGILHKIGYILWQLEKPIRSIHYFKKALETGNAAQMDSLVALNGIGINYQRLDSLHTSLYYFNRASQVALKDNNNIFNTVVMGCAAATWQKLGQLDKSYQYCISYKSISFRDSMWENAAEALYRMTLIELQKNKIVHAKILLDSFQNMMYKIKPTDYVSFKREKEANYLYYQKIADYQNALIAYKDYVYYDSLFQDYSNKNRISELELNAAVRLYEQEMVDKEHTKKRRNAISNGIVLFLLSACCFLVMYGYRKIKQTEKSKLAAEKINLNQASEIETLRIQLLAQLATIRNQNISFQASTSQNSNNIILQETINLIEPTINATADNKLNGLGLLDEFNLTYKEQWKDFKNSFSEIYPDFEKNIIAKAGAVSSAELRLMMLHKLGLSNKEIAQTLLISADGVKKAKYRLYKKIGISTSEDLCAFLE